VISLTLDEDRSYPSFNVHNPITRKPLALVIAMDIETRTGRTQKRKKIQQKLTLAWVHTHEKEKKNDVATMKAASLENTGYQWWPQQSRSNDGMTAGEASSEN
jgi:hypothetical protein